METLIIKFVPMIILIFIGHSFQKSRQVTDEVITGLKYILMNFAIPSVLFIAYVKANIQFNYILIFLAVFLINAVLLFSGKFLKKILSYSYTAWYLAGFENGMVGIPIFTAIWGMDCLPLLSLISFGNAIFVWFIYVPLLEYKNSGVVDVKANLLSLIKSPVLIAILTGMFLNITKIFIKIQNILVIKSILNLLEILGSLTIPIVFIVLGYSIQLKKINFYENLKYILIRYFLCILCGGVSFYFINKFIGKIDPLFAKLFFGYVLLPPPFILPVFIKNNKNEINFFSNTLILYTFLTIISTAVITFI